MNSLEPGAYVQNLFPNGRGGVHPTCLVRTQPPCWPAGWDMEIVVVPAINQFHSWVKIFMEKVESNQTWQASVQWSASPIRNNNGEIKVGCSFFGKMKRTSMHYYISLWSVNSKLAALLELSVAALYLDPVTLEPAMAVNIDYVVRALLYYKLPKALKFSVGRWPAVCCLIIYTSPKMM